MAHILLGQVFGFCEDCSKTVAFRSPVQDGLTFSRRTQLLNSKRDLIVIKAPLEIIMNGTKLKGYNPGGIYRGSTMRMDKGNK
ncbi:hypothetical protein HCUR_00570 [Holospora curviuscula]|uniref:Uncharacterized protein n=2 Tax=Holospora curviuscula TaxID=1082868 RepID=A0A2S5RA82_9PROT|nr:hypothetical protein HCUR_00570 [Holospora curviuscula]